MINDFLERKPLESEKAFPSIINLRIDDPNCTITCIECTRESNIIICGTQDAQIFLFDTLLVENRQQKEDEVD